MSDSTTSNSTSVRLSVLPSTIDSSNNTHEKQIENLFQSPNGSVITAITEDTNKICDTELSDIFEDYFLNEEGDSGKPIEEFYKEGVIRGLVPKNKKTQRKYQSYQSDYIQYCNNSDLNPSGKIESQFTLCNYFNDR